MQSIERPDWSRERRHTEGDIYTKLRIATMPNVQINEDAKRQRLPVAPEGCEAADETKLP